MKNDLLVKAHEILKLLAEDKNVLLTGAPATGKTTLLNMVASLFMQRGEVEVDPFGPAAFPTTTASDKRVVPGGNCSNRKVFRTTFHQGTRYRDFMRGLIPVPDSNAVRFEVSKGIMWQAAEFARQPDSASLLIIDEINRGPAVAVFGDLISAFEADKRLGENGEIIPDKTVTVQILNDSAQLEDYQLPSNLFVLAAMNQADSSVEPMDAAFLRRWKRSKIVPNTTSLFEYFDVEQDAQITSTPEKAGDVYLLAIKALEAINDKIKLGRGEDYQIGQGVLMRLSSSEIPDTVPAALQYIVDCWPVIDAHIEEIFFNDKDAIAEVLNASDDSFYKVLSYTFAGRQTIAIQQPALKSSNVYEMLLSLIG